MYVLRSVNNIFLTYKIQMSFLFMIVVWNIDSNATPFLSVVQNM